MGNGLLCGVFWVCVMCSDLVVCSFTCGLMLIVLELHLGSWWEFRYLLHWVGVDTRCWDLLLSVVWVCDCCLVCCYLLRVGV